MVGFYARENKCSRRCEAVLGWNKVSGSDRLSSTYVWGFSIASVEV